MEIGEDRLPNALKWSPINSAGYTTVADLSEVIPVLRDKSEARRALDSKFQAYSTLLKRIDEMNKSAELPLHLQERRDLARTEKELSDLQKDIEPAGMSESGEEDEKSPDIVLNESLKILADLITINPEHPEAVPKIKAPARKSMSSVMEEWIKEWL